MNRVIEFLNQAGARWADVAWAGFWQSSILIAGVWLADVVLRRRVRPVVRHALWLLVPLKLLLPPSVAFPTGLGYWIPRPGQAETQALFSHWRMEDGRESGPGAESAAVHPTRPAWARPLRPPLHGAALCLIAWAAGVTVLLGVMVKRSLALRPSRQAAAGTSGDLAGCLADLGASLRLRRPVGLQWVSAGQSPALFGLWQQCVLMPRSLEGKLSPAQWRGVLLHELVHARRGDVWMNLLHLVAQVLWWWHPLVWLSGARLRAVREEAVDDEVAFRLGTEAATYPEALLAIARAAIPRPPRSLGAIGIVESRSALRRRIERLLDDPPETLPRLGWRGGLALGLVGLLVLPMARGRGLTDSARVDPAPVSGRVTAVEVTPRDGTVVDEVLDQLTKPPIVLLEAGFVEVTDAALRELLPEVAGGSPETGPIHIPARPMSGEEHRRWLARARNQDGVRLVGAPRLTTLSGREAEIRQTEAPAHRTETLSLRAQPEVSGDLQTIRLETVARWTQGIDGTMPERRGADRKPEGDRAREAGALPAAPATGDVTRAVTNVVLLKDGGAHLLGDLGSVQGAEGRRRTRMVLLKALVIDEAGNPVNPAVP